MMNKKEQALLADLKKQCAMAQVLSWSMHPPKPSLTWGEIDALYKQTYGDGISMRNNKKVLVFWEPMPGRSYGQITKTAFNGYHISRDWTGTAKEPSWSHANGDHSRPFLARTGFYMTYKEAVHGLIYSLQMTAAQEWANILINAEAHPEDGEKP